MKLSPALFRTVSLAILFSAALVPAIPLRPDLDYAITMPHEISPDLVVESFHPESSYETFGVNGAHIPIANAGAFNLETASVEFVRSKLGIDPDSIVFRTGFSNDNGIPVANAVANVAFNRAHAVASFSSSFIKPSSVPPTNPTILLGDAITKAEATLSGQHNGHPPTIEFVVQKDGSLSLTHVVQIQNNRTGTWYEAFVDAHTGDLVHLTDFVAQASYRVLPITKETPPEGFEMLTDPQSSIASPSGWHEDGNTRTTVTAGNNAISAKGDVTTSQSSPGLVFDYPHAPNSGPTVPANVDAARTNAFYIVNTVHDITYEYGFTESAFNFQNDNYGKGGKGNDRIVISVQDPGDTNNARFATPPDGQTGTMRMYLWDYTRIRRDGSLENDIVVHENTHGLTNRMTGGGTARCLQTREAHGMSEGWSDVFAEWTEQKNETIVDYVLGQYVTDDPRGIRNYPYSTSPKTNPLRYSTLRRLTGRHDIGEVWANMLHNVYAALVHAHGFSATAHTDPTTTGGNTVFLHLFIDALPIQPCNPTFLTARDAWIQADANRYQGENRCTLWRAFASRGLGVDAANHEDDATVPSDC